MQTFSLRKLLFGLWLLAFPAFFASFWPPISFGFWRLGQVCIFLGFWLGLWVFRPKLRPLCWVFALFGLAVAFWPHPRGENLILSPLYVQKLLALRDVPYVWGGENARGIDCSGLVRRALIDACLATPNPALWREAITIWWRDCSALELKNGYGGRTRRVLEAPSLNGLDASKLQSGDLAVLQSGVHVLAHLEGRNWIQADPNLVNGGDKVIQTRAPSKNGWFSQPVAIVRWRILED